MDQISHVEVDISIDSRRQSDRSLPDISPFTNALNSITKLKAKERFARIYIIFLAMSNSYLIKNLCTRKRKNCMIMIVPMITRILLLKLFLVLKENLLFISG